MNTKENNLFSFDRNKFFYPYAINYIATFLGLISLYEKMAENSIRKLKNNQQQIDLDEFINKNLDKRVKELFQKKENTYILNTVELHSVALNKVFKFSPDILADEFLFNFEYLLPFQLKAASFLIIQCYEISKEYEDKSKEIWNFFYHCRNACSHGGFFHIGRSPRIPAIWRGIELTNNHDNKELFMLDNSNKGILKFFDPIVLLSDIEMTYIQ